MINGLGLNNVGKTTLIYTKKIQPVDRIISDNTPFLKNKFTCITKINSKLSNIYCNLKLHKNLTKVKVIITAPYRSVKSRLKAVTTALNKYTGNLKTVTLKASTNLNVKKFFPT